MTGIEPLALAPVAVAACARAATDTGFSPVAPLGPRRGVGTRVPAPRPGPGAARAGGLAVSGAGAPALIATAVG
ncbi:hypothetical protein [Streptomyces hydrogenans]|uniref:hypothetical protein n=1 Tax=Streptomyces hydrogenans TaxID=1873719 RepID=UPI003818B60E